MSNIKNVVPYRGTDEITADYRTAGPFPNCPVCECAWAQTVLTVDQQDFQLALVLIDVVCFECGAMYRLAMQDDVVLREWPNEGGESDEPEEGG